jgi:hypothetical protein
VVLRQLPLARLALAHKLIEDALPRMRSLNNQMSPRWTREAEEFLGLKPLPDTQPTGDA